jgi:hypothetical protein
MHRPRKQPTRERVFVQSLKYHGFRKTSKRKNLKFKRGYIIRATSHEDHSGIDFWVKMPRDHILYPTQITQRGVRMYKFFKQPSAGSFAEFVQRSERRIKVKQAQCKKNRIAFVLVRDYIHNRPDANIAWGDIKALRYAINHLRRWT